jgi:hypothetical protein
LLFAYSLLSPLLLLLQERRERLMKEQLEKMRADNPKITEQFADLKRGLAQVCITQCIDLKGCASSNAVAADAACRTAAADGALMLRAP